MADQIHLLIQIVVSPDILENPRDLRDLEIYVNQYASGLIRDLQLPLSISTPVISALVPYGPSTFQLLINEQPCRMRLWPAASLKGMPVREIASVISEAFHYCRLSLLTDDLSALIADKWNLKSEDAYRNGWTAAGFTSFLSEFVRRNLSLTLARTFVETNRPGAATQTDAQLCFEEALERATNYGFGMKLWLGSALAEDALVKEMGRVLENAIRWCATDPGIVLPDISISYDAGLHSDGFRIQINDVRLPEFSAFPIGCKIATAPGDGLAKLKPSSKPIIQPIDAISFRVVQLSPEMEASSLNEGVQFWDQSSYISLAVQSAANLHAGSMIAAPVTQFFIEKLKRDAPDLVEQAQTRLQTLGSNQSSRLSNMRWTITAILRLLLDESVIIRDFRAVLEGLLLLRELHNAARQSRVVAFRTPHSPLPVAERTNLQDLNLADLAQCARFALRTLALRYTLENADGLSLPSLLFSPAVEQRLLETEQKPLTPAEIRLLHNSVFNLLSTPPPDARFSNILVAQQFRLQVSNMLSVEFPTIGILGHFEFPPNLKGVVPAGLIDFPSAAAAAT